MTGGLSDQIVEAPIMPDAAAATTGSQINTSYIVVNILATLLIASAVGQDDDEEVQ